MERDKPLATRGRPRKKLTLTRRCPHDLTTPRRKARCVHSPVERPTALPGCRRLQDQPPITDPWWVC